MTLKRFINRAMSLFWFSVATALANGQSNNFLQNPSADDGANYWRISVMRMSSKRLKAIPISESETRDTSYKMSPWQKAQVVSTHC